MNKCEGCASYAGGLKCIALTACCGSKKDCSFFKTAEQAEQDRRQAFVRILKLPREQRRRIMQTYYGQADITIDEVTP